MRPVITILVSTYNRPNELSQFLKSIKEQTYESWQVFILDESPSKYSRIYEETDPRIHPWYVEDRNDWGYTAKETIADFADGDWLYFPNDDHRVPSNFLELMLQKAAMENADLVYCDFQHPKLGSVRGAPSTNRVDIGTFIVRAPVFLERGFFDKGAQGDGKFVERVAENHKTVRCNVIVGL